jgi:hypothetical protein
MATRIRVTDEHLKWESGGYPWGNAVALAVNCVLGDGYYASASPDGLTISSCLRWPDAAPSTWTIPMSAGVACFISDCQDGKGYPLEFDLEIPAYMLREESPAC